MSKHAKEKSADLVEGSAAELELSQEAVAFLTQECERLLGLYSQAQSNAQSVFNFYLTFVTTVVGAVIVLLQVSPASASSLLSALLFFSVIVGSVYMSSLSGKYAHAARYARAVDEIRRYLIQGLGIPTPGIYQQFLAAEDRPASKSTSWVLWLIPTGTYQMFMAIVNSVSLGAMAGLIITSAGAGLGRAVVAAVLVFALALTIYNAYSRLIIHTFERRLNVRIDMGRDLSVWAARE